MSITDHLLAAFLLYGLPLLFGITVVASIGVPIPVRLVLLEAGSFARQGEMELVPVVVVAIVAAVIGDNVGFGLARWGGRPLIVRWSRRLGVDSSVEKAEQALVRWGNMGVFLSRWLVTELGSATNVMCGVAAFSWRHFLLWDVVGEVIWVGLYVGLGYQFSDRIQSLTEILSDVAWLVLGLVGTVLLGWKAWQSFRPETSSAA